MALMIRDRRKFFKCIAPKRCELDNVRHVVTITVKSVFEAAAFITEC